MSVLIPAAPRGGFYKKGVPLTGYEFGDSVGKMLWGIGITFETSEEPIDRGRLVRTSRVTGTALYDKVTRHFYPTGTQLSGQNAPADGTYTRPIDAETLSALINQVAAAASSVGGPSNSGSSALADRLGSG